MTAEFPGYDVIEAPDWPEDVVVESGRIDKVQREESMDVQEKLSVEEPVQREEQAKLPLDVDYEFGDAGSSWRMMKLNKVLEEAEKEKIPLDDAAKERYSSLLQFDIAREEKRELELRKQPGHAPVVKPTGHYAKERGIDISARDTVAQPRGGPKVTQAELTALRVKAMRAKLRKDPQWKTLEEQYKEKERMFRSQPQEEEDMSVQQMLKEERLSRDVGYGESAKQILKDRAFDDDLEAQDENSASMVKAPGRKDYSVESMQRAAKMEKVMDRCLFCVEGETSRLAVVSEGYSTYLSVAPQPELTEYAAVICPFRHIRNTLHSEDEEEIEIRNYMRSLSRFYYEELRMGVVFYENAVSEYNHARVVAVPIPLKYDSSTVLGFFKSGILEESDEIEAQHRLVIETLKKSEQLGSGEGMKHLIAKEAPYFHVWVSLDGGLGHIVEDPQQWPTGELFARRVIGGIIGADKFLINAKLKQVYTGDEAAVKFATRWQKYDWTKELVK